MIADLIPGSTMILWKSTEFAYKLGNWRTFPIVENGEPLVQVPSDMCSPYYADVMKLTNDRRIFVRSSVLDRLFVAKAALEESSGLQLMVLDGWRSIQVQEALFWHYLKVYTAEKFGLSLLFKAANSTEEIRRVFEQLEPRLRNEVKEANLPYVSWPSSLPSHPSPHATGGAVDVWVYQNGQPATLGVPFDWMEETASAFYHLRKGRRTYPGNDTQVCRNRNALLSAMDRADFSCYPAEIWHFNFGNQMDALVSGRTAQYSYVEPPLI